MTIQVDTELDTLTRETSPVALHSSSVSDNAMLPIVLGQRERLRLRNDELETSNLEQQNQIKTLTAQLHDMQQDNVKLFEKIRFLQSCSGNTRYC